MVVAENEKRSRWVTADSGRKSRPCNRAPKHHYENLST